MMPSQGLARLPPHENPVASRPNGSLTAPRASRILHAKLFHASPWVTKKDNKGKKGEVGPSAAVCGPARLARPEGLQRRATIIPVAIDFER